MSISIRRAGYIAYGCVLVALTGWFVADFPILRVILAVGYVAYAACLWRWPWLWLVAVPALLALFDLASWSGRFFFDEFDALVLLTAGVLALRETTPGPVAQVPRDLKWILALLAVSYFVSTAIRLWPPVPVTVDSFANYASPYNSLRVAKGFVWALLLLQPLRQAVARFPHARLLLGYGFLIGLIAVALVSLYERWLFTGILTLVTTYRTTASFSSMHTGDGPIDVWLAMTIPFVGLLFTDRRWLSLLPLTIALVLLSVYALIATQSRSPVIAVSLAYCIGLLAMYATRSHRRRVGGAILFSLGIATLIATIGLPLLLQSSFAQRFSQTQEDALIRVGHWRDSLALRDRSFLAEVFGMGLGSFPAMHQQRSTREPRASRYRYVSNGADHFLTLWSSQTLYMGQEATATQNAAYAFSAKVRTSEPHATFTVAWCELWMLSSENCTWDTFALQALPGQWQTLSRTINTGQVGSGRHVMGFLIERPTRLTFFVSGAPTTGVDVSGLSLIDAQGRELLRNGDFSDGSDNWFWTVDEHLQWHIKNLAVNILFDQGWLGLIAVGMLLGVLIGTLARRIGRGDALSAIYLASIIGFLVTGVTVSTFDQPRLALAFYLLCFAVLVTDVGESEVQPDALVP